MSKSSSTYREGWRADRGAKASLYARARVPTYWLVDVPTGTVEVRSDPSEDGYRCLQVYTSGKHVPSPARGVPDLSVAELLAGLAD